MAILISTETLKPERLKPVRMFGASHDFNRAESFSFRAVTSYEAAVVEKKTKEFQIVVPDLSAEEKIIPQTTV